MAEVDSTITDKKSFSCNVVDKKKYEALSQDEKELFEVLRNSLLEIFPIGESNTYSDETIRYAENFAFIAYKGVLSSIDKKLEKVISEIKTEVQTMITAGLASAGGGATGGTTV